MVRKSRRAKTEGHRRAKPVRRGAVPNRKEGGGEDSAANGAGPGSQSVPSLHGMFLIALDSRDFKRAGEIVKKIEKVEPDYQSLPALRRRLEAGNDKNLEGAVYDRAQSYLRHHAR